MVDRFLNCTRSGCDGVAICSEADLRKKNLTFVCQKCGNKFTIKRSDYNAGLNAFNLGPLGDWLSGGFK